MSNIKIVFPKEESNIYSPYNNCLIIKKDIDKAFIETDNELLYIPVTYFDELQEGLECASIGDCGELIKQMNLEKLINYANTFKVNDYIKRSDNFEFNYSNKDISGIIYPSDDVEFLLEVKGECVLIIGNTIIKDQTKIVTLKKQTLTLVRMIFHDGKINFNIDKNIFFTPKETKHE